MNEQTDTDAISGKPMPKATPAATIIIFRDNPDGGAPLLLMVERSAKMAFAAGAAVFPGGRVDPDDMTFSAELLPNDDPAEAAARVAAVRETVEETGLAIGFRVVPNAEQIVSARAALAKGEMFSKICKDNGWELDLDQFVPFTRWRPPFHEARVFDTRFFVAQAGPDVGNVSVDETENFNLFWATAEGVLDKAEKEEIKIIFPTRRNLERLAQLHSVAEVEEHMKMFPAELVVPHMEKREDGGYLCIKEGIGYPVTAERMSSVRRG